MPRRQYDETKFRPGQRLGAELMLEYELMPEGKRRKLDDIAAEVGVTRMTLWNWNNKDENFIAYKNHLAAKYMDSNLPIAYRQLMAGIENGSMKGIELFLRRYGDLDRRDEVTVHHAESQSHEERIAALQKRLDELDGGEDK